MVSKIDKTNLCEFLREIFPFPKNPVKALDILILALQRLRNEKALIFLPHLEAIAPHNPQHADMQDRVSTLMLLKFFHESSLIPKDSSLIFAIENIADLAASLRDQRGYEVIEISFPDEEERSIFLKTQSLADGNEGEISRLSGGLALRDFEHMARKKELNPDRLTQVKSVILEKTLGDLLIVKEPRWGFEIGLGGLKEIKSFFMDIIPDLRRADPRVVPPGVHLYGPPGTGKSAFAECLAFEVGVPFVEILNLFNMYVGESERNALRLMSMLKALAPCVVFIDEADQNEAPRGSWVGDSGTGNRIRKIQFEVMGDQALRGKILWLQATNMPDLLDPAYKRSGRGSVRAPFLLPDNEEAVDIFKVMTRRYDFRTKVKFLDVVETLRRVHGFCVSGADIEEMSLSAYRLSRMRGMEVVEKTDYMNAIEDFVPHDHPKKGPCDYERMEIIAVKGRSSNRLLSRRGLNILKTVE